MFLYIFVNLNKLKCNLALGFALHTKEVVSSDGGTPLVASGAYFYQMKMEFELPQPLFAMHVPLQVLFSLHGDPGR